MTNQTSKEKIHKLIDSLNKESIDAQKTLLKEAISQYTSQEDLKNTLSILYEFGEKNLELIKNHIDEIKFSTSIQQEIRKERSQFFSQTLREVSVTLKEAQINDDIASKWLVELVKCYTESLAQSSSLIQDYTIDLLSNMRRESAKILHKYSQDDKQDENK